MRPTTSSISVRNVGTGIAVLHGWHLIPELVLERSAHVTPPPLEDFTSLTRDLYVAPGDIGFWQGSFRDPGATATSRPVARSKRARRSASTSSTATSKAASG